MPWANCQPQCSGTLSRGSTCCVLRLNFCAVLRVFEIPHAPCASCSKTYGGRKSKSPDAEVAGPAPRPMFHMLATTGRAAAPRGDSFRFLTDERGGFESPCSPGCPSTVDIYPYWSKSPEYFHEQEVAVPSNACGDLWTLHLERRATLSGTVADAHGHGVSDLSIKLVRDGEATCKEWTTGPDGSHSFHPLPPGRYDVQLHEMLERGEDRFLYLASEDQPLTSLPVVEIPKQQDVKLDIVATPGGMLGVEGVQIPDDARSLPITWLYVVPADASGAADGRAYDLGDGDTWGRLGLFRALALGRANEEPRGGLPADFQILRFAWQAVHPGVIVLEGLPTDRASRSLHPCAGRPWPRRSRNRWSSSPGRTLPAPNRSPRWDRPMCR